MRLLPSLRTVRARLTLWNVGVLAIVLLVLGGSLRLSAERNMLASVDREIAGRARRHQNFWAHAPERGYTPWERPSWWSDMVKSMRNNTSAGNAGRRFTEETSPASRWQVRVQERLYNMKGEQVFPLGEDLPWDRDSCIYAGRGHTVYMTLRIGNEQVRILYAPLRAAGQIKGVAQVGYSLADVNRALGNLNRTLLTFIPIALAAAGIGGLFLTGRMLRPVREATHAAARIGAEDLSRRLPVNGSDEFSELAATFNGMLGRLERAFEQQRRFAADASHELRTPLTVIKANTSLALSRDDLSGEQRKVMESVDRAAGVMNRIVQDLLLLARSDAGQLELTLRPTRLSEVLEVAVECARIPGGPAICNEAEETDLAVQGDTSHLIRLFVNLLENAVRHTPREGCITLSARREGSAVIVTVEDTGAGISPEHLPHVCERFYRVDEARSRAQGGTGLGLAICQSIVRAHGGSLDITSSPGAGTTVRVTLRHATVTDDG
jgi:heavy metal sensor kinase